jgi:hypothetical protein
MSSIAAAPSPAARRILRAASRATAVILVLGATACMEPPTAPRQLDIPDKTGGVLLPPNDGAWTSWNVAKQGTPPTATSAAPRSDGNQP